MNDLQEIVTVAQAERIINLLALALPVAGLLLGVVIGSLRKRPIVGLLVGLLSGLVGPVIWLLWRMYNGIIGVFGLDSVKGLLINLALFIVIGVVIGLALGAVRRRIVRPAETN
jgi:hypothetical protein